MEPPVDAICAALAELDIVRAPAFERTFEYVDDAGKVIGVNGVSARPSLEVFERLAEVVEDLRVDELDRSVRCQNRNESGNPVDDIVESELALHSALVTASFLTPKLASVRPDVRSRETFKRVFGVWSETIRDADARTSPKSSIFLRRIIGSMFMRVNAKCAQPSLCVHAKAVHRSA